MRLITAAGTMCLNLVLQVGVAIITIHYFSNSAIIIIDSYHY